LRVISEARDCFALQYAGRDAEFDFGYGIIRVLIVHDFERVSRVIWTDREPCELRRRK
jgi:hypothetical protein